MNNMAIKSMARTVLVAALTIGVSWATYGFAHGMMDDQQGSSNMNMQGNRGMMSNQGMMRGQQGNQGMGMMGNRGMMRPGMMMGNQGMMGGQQGNQGMGMMGNRGMMGGQQGNL